MTDRDQKYRVEPGTGEDADTVAESSSRERERAAAATTVRRAAPGRGEEAFGVVTEWDDAPLDDPAFDVRYRTGDLIGEGGMGRVLACKDARIGREVALKVLRQEGGNISRVQRRFLREARIQAQLEHPSVVPVYELGARADGAAFFTMKRVHGQTLAEIIEDLAVGDPVAAARHTHRRLLSAFSNVCLAMAYAHSRGVVHRDLKPSNIILGEFGEVYVLDWGLAKVIDSPPNDRVSDPGPAPLEPGATGPSGGLETAAGAVLGTPGYMAPEQARGRIDEIDGRADVYALGAILFELLTLQPLHVGESSDLLILSTLEGGSGPASGRAPGRGIAPELDEVCTRATALSPMDRFQSARELHEAIERYLDGVQAIERRRQLAQEHVSRARQALARAQEETTGGATVLPEAIRELNAAIALDPSNRQALDELIRVCTEAADVLPPEAERDLAAVRRADHARFARTAALALFGALAVFPIIGLTEVRSLPWLFVMGGLYCAGGVVALLASRAREHRRWHCALLAFLEAAAAASTFALFGPFVLVPGVAVASIMPIIVNSRATRPDRGLMLAMALCAILVPVVLQWLGVLPPSYEIGADSLRVLPLAIGFPEVGTQAVLLATGMAIVVIPMLVVGTTVGALDAAERRLFARAWNLRNLIPGPDPSDSKGVRGRQANRS